MLQTLAVAGKFYQGPAGIAQKNVKSRNLEIKQLPNLDYWGEKHVWKDCQRFIVAFRHRFFEILSCSAEHEIFSASK